MKNMSVDKYRYLGFGFFRLNRDESSFLAKELAKEEKSEVIANTNDWSYALIYVEHKDERWSIAPDGFLKTKLSEHIGIVEKNRGCARDKIRVRPLSLSLWP